MPEPEILAAFRTSIVGRACLVERWEHSWPFVFGMRGRDWGCTIVVASPWRVIADGRTACSAEDDSQMFGRTDPFDALNEANSLLNGRSALAVDLDIVTADLRIEFGSGVQLDVFNMSSGYEAWIASFQDGGASLDLVATGGGSLSFTSNSLDPGPIKYGRPRPGVR